MVALSPALTELGRRTNQLRIGIKHSERASSVRDTVAIEVAAVQRGATYVWLGAALEVFVRSFVSAITDELNGMVLQKRQVLPSVLSLVHADEFDSLRDITGLDMWNKRAFVLNETFGTSIAQFNPDIRPLDGKTIRPDHLSTIWEIVGLPGSPFPSPSHRLRLNEIATTRNHLAHGHSDPVGFGRAKTWSDVLRAVDYVDDIAVEMVAAAEDYFSNSMYLR